MIAGEDCNKSVGILIDDMKQAQDDRRSGAAIALLNELQRRLRIKIMAEICFVRSCDGIDGAPRRNATRSAQLRLLQQGMAAYDAAELLGPIVAGDDACKAAKSHTIAARKNNSPTTYVRACSLSAGLGFNGLVGLGCGESHSYFPFNKFAVSTLAELRLGSQENLNAKAGRCLLR